jgi:hypothetical protein
MVELHLHSPMRLHGLGFNKLSSGTILPFILLISIFSCFVFYPNVIYQSMALQALWTLAAFFFISFLIYKELVGLLERGISPGQGRYLHT